MLARKLRIAPNIPGISRETRHYPLLVARLSHDQRNIDSARFVVVSNPVIALLDHPYRGRLGLSPEAFEIVYHDVMLPK